jgi:TonB family protein
VTADFTLEIPENAGPPAPGPVISTKEWRGGFADRSSDTGPLVPGREGVDREVVPLPTNPAPRYPAELRAAGIQGSVFARFVVDTAGRVRMETVSVDASDHPRFAEAVIEALRRSRYTPAELRGRKVPQLVVQPFVFVLRD